MVTVPCYCGVCRATLVRKVEAQRALVRERADGAEQGERLRRAIVRGQRIILTRGVR